MPKTALLLIDIQNDYFPSFKGSRMALPNMDAAAQRAAELLAAARETETPVIHVRHVMASDAAPFFKPGTAGAALHESVTPQPDEPIIDKPRPNSFVATGLEKHLREAGIDYLVICGAMSQMCIDATVRAAADLSFTVTVASDACAAANVSHGGVDVPADLVHAAIMAPLASSYGQVRAASDCIEVLRQGG
ncbi:cysteine hydrolase family protein [Phycobacter sp. K97]|uniref:cysteine hydrolase family protein n=1 Tax=Phycobacter sedimenti TaxID=3133977 RepID=UPI0031201807